MKITKLRLEGYKRLKLNQIRTIELDFTAPIQLILGTNGSGKSSIFAELSPLPADPKWYSKPGGKVIEITHEGSYYVLTSTFDANKSIHSFVKDSENLNEGGTITVQRDLVKKFFKYTQQLHDFFLAKTGFCAMKTPERRAWYNILSNANYDYALGLYGRVSTRWRDKQGALRTARERLVTETTKILRPEQHQELVDEAARLHEALHELMELRRPIDHPMSNLLDDAQSLQAEMQNAAAHLGNMVKSFDRTMPMQVSTLQDILNEADAAVRFYRLQSDQHYDEHLKLQQTLDSLKKTSLQSTAAIDVEISALEKENAELHKSLNLPIEITQDPKGSLAALMSSSTWLHNVLEALPKNADKHYSRATFDRANKDLEEHRVALMGVEKTIHEATALKTHMEALKSQGAIECPNCKHHWIRNYSETKHNEALESIEIGHRLKGQLEALIKQGTELVDSIRNYFQLYKSYNEVTSQWPVLQGLWTHIQDTELLMTNPGFVVNMIEQYKQDLGTTVKILDNQRLIVAKQELLATTQANAGLDLNALTQRSEELNARIFEDQTKLQRAQQVSKQTIEQMNRHVLMNTVKSKVEDLIREYSDTYAKARATLQAEAVQECVRHVQSLLASTETALKASLSQNRVIDDINTQIAQLEQEERCLKILMKELSPTEGLIAEGIFGFMNVFTKQMNQEIKKVWSYPLEVQPCKLDASGEVDLDYKFPLLVDTVDNVMSDVSEGSSAMQEIVDHAFRETAGLALGLTGFPLMLDEFGKTMDPVHKNATIAAIQNTMDRDRFSQLFMISHDIGQYSGLTDTQVCVLHPGNIVIPKNVTYNKHVVMQ